MKPETLPRTWSAAESANSSVQRFLSAFQVIARNRLALFGVIIIGVWLLTALLAPFMATHDPYEINIAQRLKGPSADHWLGTDYLGRDSYS
ncbi:MAG: ABC transporter permease, partial [Candidatus Binatia bacterium]